MTWQKEWREGEQIMISIVFQQDLNITNKIPHILHLWTQMLNLSTGTHTGKIC